MTEKSSGITKSRAKDFLHFSEPTKQPLDHRKLLECSKGFGVPQPVLETKVKNSLRLRMGWLVTAAHLSAHSLSLQMDSPKVAHVFHAAGTRASSKDNGLV